MTATPHKPNNPPSLPLQIKNLKNFSKDQKSQNRRSLPHTRNSKFLSVRGSVASCITLIHISRGGLMRDELEQRGCGTDFNEKISRKKAKTAVFSRIAKNSIINNEETQRDKSRRAGGRRREEKGRRNQTTDTNPPSLSRCALFTRVSALNLKQGKQSPKSLKNSQCLRRLSTSAFDLT